ncbi:MAG: FtsQ-type POTRA domain-containing protein [Peptoniphilus sp.]|nr:FtsQ-type POTRA domain-containing protein [Peptoniphilus sp.]
MKENRKEKYRIRAKRKNFIRKIILLMMILTITFFVLTKTGFFNVSSIKVLGNESISREEIIKRSGIAMGQNYFSVSKKDRVEAINSIAKIKSSKIKFSVSGDTTIEVVERKGIMQIENYASYYIIDRDLRIIEIMSRPFQNLKDIKGVNIQNLDLGDYILTKEKDKREFLAQLIDTEEIFNSIKGIEFKEDMYVLMDNNDVEIQFNSIEDLEYKFRMLVEILKDIETTNKNAIRIEMDNGYSPIVVLQSTYDEKENND